MSVLGDTPDVICGCLGCGAAATCIIDHNQHGERRVCDDHAEGHEVIGHV